MHTLCHIRAFSGTNLLTRCRSASSCFLLFLVSEILVTKYSRNRTKSTPRFLFSPEPSRTPESRQREALGAPHHTLAWPEGGGRAALWCGPLVSPLTLPFRLLKASVAKPLMRKTTIRKTLLRRRRRRSHLGGFWRSPPAPCRRGDSSPGGLYTAMVASGVMSE